MRRTLSVYCLECDHEHDCPVLEDEQGQFYDTPDNCENCGEDMTETMLSEPAARKHERQQMGICS